MSSRTNSASIGLALLALVLVARTPAHAQGGYDAALRHMNAGRYALAEAALADETAPLARQRGLAELYFRARDLPRSLREARRGLEDAPDDLLLLHRATASGVWMGDCDIASEYAAKLSRAVAASGLAGDERTGWERAASELEAAAVRLRERAEARDDALRSAKLVSAVALGVTLLGLLWIGVFSYGRSSKPL